MRQLPSVDSEENHMITSAHICVNVARICQVVSHALSHGFLALAVLSS